MKYQKQTEFEEYKERNPRELIPDSLKGFLEYAMQTYKQTDNVNWTYFDDESECEDEVRTYISQCSEALLLFKEYLKQSEGGDK